MRGPFPLFLTSPNRASRQAQAARGEFPPKLMSPKNTILLAQHLAPPSRRSVELMSKLTALPDSLAGDGQENTPFLREDLCRLW